MQCQINYGLWGSVFAIPTLVVDDLLPLSNENQLKVLLYLLRHAQSAVSSEQIAEALHLRCEAVEEALLYWVGTGLLLSAEAGTIAPLKQTTEPKTSENPVPAIGETAGKVKVSARKRKNLPPLPTSTEAIRHFAENPALADFQRVIEGTLNRPITAHDLQVITWCLDVLAMPQEVFCLLCQFCALRGKASSNQLKFTAEDWWEQEIDSYQQAEEHLAALERLESTCEKLCKKLGWETALTQDQQVMILSWKQSMGFDEAVIHHAFDLALEASAKNPFTYANKVLSDWQSKGLKTLPAIHAYEETEAPGREAIRCVRRVFGTRNSLSTKQEDYAVDWMVKMQFSEDVIQKAYTLAQNAGAFRPFAYVNRVLHAWHEKGLIKAEEIERDMLKNPKQYGDKKAAFQKSTSYNLSDIHHLLDDLSEEN